MTIEELLYIDERLFEPKRERTPEPERHIFIGYPFNFTADKARQKGLDPRRHAMTVRSALTGLRGRSGENLVIHLCGSYYTDSNWWNVEGQIKMLVQQGAKVEYHDR